MSARAGMPAEFLDVDVQQLAGVAALVAVGWLGRLQLRALAQSDPVRSAGTVESAIPRHSAISAAVMRNRRRAAIAATH